jgi:peptidoglycan/LPS O-acetylase OafA/YrhL
MLFSLTLSAIAMLLLASPSSFKIYGKQAFATILFAGNYGAFKNSGDYFDNFGNPLIHTWSLSVEEQIYFVLPIVLVLLLGKYRYTKNRFTLIVLMLTVISLIVFIVPSILQPIYKLIGISNPNQLSFYSPIHRIWQFTVGGLGYLIVNNFQSLTGKKTKIIHQFTSLFLIIIIFGSFTTGSKYASIFVSLFSFLVICFRSLDFVPKIIKHLFKWLGDRSYSVYLFHMPFIFIAKSSPYSSDSKFRGIYILLAVALSISLGALSYSKIENRYRINSSSSRLPFFKIIEILASMIISVSLCFILTIGANNNFWGFQKNPAQPIAAWELDDKCARMSGDRPFPCVYQTSNATKSVLLIGDSLAAQFSQALIDAAENANWNSAIWTMPSCNFVLRNNNGKVSDSCLKFNKSIIEWVIRYKPSLVIVSQFNRKELNRQELEEAILKLKNLVPSVLAVGNTPVFRDTRYMSSPALFQNNYKAPKKVLISKMNLENDEASTLFLEGLEQKSVETINLNSLWCDLKYCNRFGTEGWLFFDRLHLSVVGAAKAIPFFTNLLNNK